MTLRPGAALAAGAAGTALAALAACSAPPRHRAGDLVVPPPPAWQSAPDTGEGAAADQDWWRKLGDARLTAAIAAALQHNHDVQAARMRLAAAAAQARLAGAAAAPLLDLGTSGQRQRSVFVGLPFGGTGPFTNTFDSFGVDLNASWEIDVWNRLGAAEDASRAEVLASAADLRGLRQSLAGQTAKAWFAAVEARQQIALAQQTIQSYRATEAQVENRFQRGVRSALDLRLARTQRISAETQLHVWEERYQRAVRQLELLQGRYPTGRVDLPDALPAGPGPTPAGIPADIIQHRPDLVAAERRLAAAGFRVDEAQGALYPRLSLSGQIGTTSDRVPDLLDLDFLIWNLAANLVAPVLDGGARRAQRDAAIFRENEAVAAFAQSVLRAYTEVETVLATEGLLAQQVASLAAASAESSAARDLSEDRYRRGLGDFLAVLDAQRSALQIEAQRISTQRQVLDLRVDLHLALGAGFVPPARPDGEPR